MKLLIKDEPEKTGKLTGALLQIIAYQLNFKNTITGIEIPVEEYRELLIESNSNNRYFTIDNSEPKFMNIPLIIQD